MSADLRVLLVEDSTTDAALVVRALRESGRAVTFERVEDADAMTRALATSTFDVVISDWSMPRFSGLGALAVLRATGLDIPFIIVSGTIGERVAVEAMRAGAHDYALKDDLARLAPAVERELRERDLRGERRQAEDTLAKHQARFRALIEHSHEGVTLTVRSGVPIYISPAGRRILGFGEDGPGPTSLWEVAHPEDRVRMVASLEGSRPGLPTTIELRIVRPDGTVRWVELTRTDMMDDPAVGAIVANFRDITERRRAFDALHVSEARFARLWESGILGVTIATVLGQTLEANDAYLSMLGYTRAEFVAGTMHWADMTPPEWRDVDIAATSRLASEGVAPPWEKEMFHKDGHRVPIQVAVAMLEYPNCIAVVTDLTERKRAEHALSEMEAQLRQAQKMEAVGRLAGGIAHDFNNLLTVILSYSDFALEELRDGDPLRDSMTEIQKAALRAAELTKQLLMFSRRQVLEPKAIDLNDVVEGMDRMLQRVLGEDIELVIVPAHSLSRVRVDKGSIEQVIMNLAVNARDAMPMGGQLTLETDEIVLGEEFVSTHVGMHEGVHVMLAVTDTGIGMDRATQARIFEPFFTTKEVGRGTGLGLSTVFGIVQMSGGAIWVYSEPGRGTSFKIYLPRVDVTGTADAPVLAPADLRGSEVILLVEDEDQVRVVIRDILKRFGYIVIDARGAADALFHCEHDARAFDLLVTDVVMPQMSGPELAKRLTAMRPGMKVLCISGYTDDSVVRHGVLEADIAYLQKPITPESLGRKVREVLGPGGVMGGRELN